MRTNTKAVVTGDGLGDHWGTGTFWELAVIIYVQHLQICFKSAGTVEKRQVLVCHTKSMELSQHFWFSLVTFLNLSDLLRKGVHSTL